MVKIETRGFTCGEKIRKNKQVIGKLENNILSKGSAIIFYQYRRNMRNF
jgi:hypothetical protein